MTHKEIVHNYLKALNFKDDIKNLQHISKLIQAHEKTFAFSSMKVLLQEDISLELQDIYENIVVKKRGGYCFEHNKLFYEVLKELGFEVEYYLARVINNTDKEVPQTHRITLLHHKDEKYLIDVGIGFRSPCVPVKLSEEPTYSHLDISYNVKAFDDKTFGLQLFENNVPFRVTKFDLNPCFEADFEMGHFYSFKHPDAAFVNNLVISLIFNNEIRSLRNKNYLKIYEGHQKEVVIESLEQFQSILRDELNSSFTLSEIKSIYTKHIKESH